MTSTTKHVTLSSFRVLFLFLVASCVLPAPAQTTDELKKAVSLLQQFQGEVSNLRTAVRKPLGPYTISTQCTWCSAHAWWGLGFCTENTTQTVGPLSVDFNWTRARLDGVLREAEQNASTFSTSYAPTQAWLNGLPEFSKKFTANADLILAVQQEIKAGNGPTDQQRQIVTQALRKLTDDLGSSSKQLEMGTKALADFLQRQSSYREAIKEAIAGADRSAQEALANLEKNVRDRGVHPSCLDNLVNNHFNPIKGEFSNSIQAISGAFQKLEASSREAENGVAVLLGSVLNSQTELKTALDLVNAAKNDQLGSFLERLHLASAKKLWDDLAAAYKG